MFFGILDAALVEHFLSLWHFIFGGVLSLSLLLSLTSVLARAIQKRVPLSEHTAACLYVRVLGSSVVLSCLSLFLHHVVSLYKS